jgi:hypothetical protein
MFKKACLSVLTALLLGGCASGNWVFLPKYPYPFDKHQEGKTATYEVYKNHFGNAQDLQRRQSPTRY